MAQRFVTSDFTRPEQKPDQLLRRSRLETYGDLLIAIAKGPIRPTHIMYRANLAWTTMKEYLNVLSKFGFVTIMEDDRGTTLYSLSSAGYGLLERFLEIKEGLGLDKEVEREELK